MSDIAPLLWRLGPFGIAACIVVYVYLNPEKAEIWGSWAWRLIGLVFRSADNKAVAYRVQGEVNSATAKLFGSAPVGMVEGKLKIHWTTAEDMPTVVRNGEVVVFMQRSDQREQNVAKATMLYVPKAIVPRARPYVNPTIMEAVDLVVAKSILAEDDENIGVLDTFFRDYLDVAMAESNSLRERLDEIDEIDLQGWLTRVLLREYLYLGRDLYPALAQDSWLRETEAFARWLHKLATKKPGDYGSLDYRGPLLSVGIIFVAERQRLAIHGLDIYRKRVKRLLYLEKLNVVYLMGRDDNISTVRHLLDSLRSDAMIASIDEHEYGLRRDFKARKSMNKERAIVVALRRRQKGGFPVDILPADDDTALLPADTYEFAKEQQLPLEPGIEKRTRASLSSCRPRE
jgi:hypothetical protein